MKLIRSFSVRRNSSIKEDAAVSVGAERRKEEVASATKEEHTAATRTTRRNSGGGGANNNDKMMKDAKYGAKASAEAGATTTTAVPALTVPFETPNEELVVKFFNSPSSGEHHDLSQFFTPDADWLFQDAHMTMPGFLAEMQKVFQSFPDFRFHIHSVQEQPDGTVLARINAVGTHTGAPFAFGPYPEIQATGIRVTMDHEYVSPQLLFCVLCVIECV
jgi:ketosteroid isomerase-like protein